MPQRYRCLVIDQETGEESVRVQLAESEHAARKHFEMQGLFAGAACQVKALAEAPRPKTQQG
ncbi:MAG: hypothetical protein AB8F26_02380 [Phycisphaerales bacterium]